MVIENIVTDDNRKRGKTINAFFDTEFTRFRDMEHEPKLISIGLVADDGREFYAELRDTWDISDCSDFVKGVVLELLDNKEYIKEADLAVQLKAWIEGLGDSEVVLRCDSPAYDWQLVVDLFNFYGMWPANLRRKCGTVFFDNDRQRHRYQSGLSMYWQEHQEHMHHALVDARSMRFAWKYAIKRGL